MPQYFRHSFSQYAPLSWVITVIYSSLHGFFRNQINDKLPVCLLSQLVEHCIGVAEVMGSNPVQIFRPYFHYCLLLRLEAVNSIIAFLALKQPIPIQKTRGLFSIIFFIKTENLSPVLWRVSLNSMFIEVDSLIKYEASVKKPPFWNPCSFSSTRPINEYRSFFFLCKAIKPTKKSLVGKITLITLYHFICLKCISAKWKPRMLKTNCWVIMIDVQSSRQNSLAPL